MGDLLQALLREVRSFGRLLQLHGLLLALLRCAALIRLFLSNRVSFRPQLPSPDSRGRGRGDAIGGGRASAHT